MAKQEQIDKINETIQDLVYEKIQLKKAYNYYHCTRDAEQFRHIEDNYGIGVPTSIGFTPLVKKHIDVLVGEYLELDPEMKISCKDPKTIDNTLRDKKLKIDSALYKYLEEQLRNVIVNVFFNKQESVVNDPFIEQEMLKIQRDIDKSFVSEYEIAAQNILQYLKQSRDIDLKNKMRDLFTDLLITGCCYYRTKPNGSKIKLEILNPLDTFVERNRNEFYLNKSPRCAIRRWLTKEQVLQEYGDKLSREAISNLDDQIRKGDRNYNTVYVRSHATTVNDTGGTTTTRQVPTPGILGGLEVTPVFPWNSTGMYNYLGNPVIAVYDVEWLEYNLKNHELERHCGTKIGSDIYIAEDKYKEEDRIYNEGNINLNGMFFLDKNGSPFSIMLSTMELQDRYDLLLYYRDNLIASSGTVGDWIDIAHLPSVLGVKLPERLEKWIAYKKNGIALFDSSQEGADMLNTTFNGFDDTIKAHAIQAIQIAIDSIEMQAAAITGVFPEKLGGIQERDAVSNVKVGIKYSTLLTKQYFSAMDLMYKEVNYDLLNLAKVVFDKGVTGTLILGNKYNKIFTALPKHYTVTDFDVHIEDSTENLQTRETMKALNIEMIQAGLADPEMVINIVMSKSTTELKQYIEEAMKSKKQENNQLQQLSQQLEEYQQAYKQLEKQLKQLDQTNKQLEAQIQRNNDEQIAIERKRVSLEEEELKHKRQNDAEMNDLKKKQIEAEILQVYDQSPFNDKIKNIL